MKLDELEEIENKDQYNLVLKRIDELIEVVDNETPIDDKNMQELIFLANLISHYEEIHYPIGKLPLKKI